MMIRYPIVLLMFAIPLLIGGCMNYYAIPEPFDKEVNRSVTFATLKEDPDAHKGEVLALGGVVLRAKNLKDGTQIEVLQLPLDRYDQPDFPLEASQGRFMVLDPEHHDPAVLKNRRITVVGEVIGKKIDMIDEAEYTFPYLSARMIHISSQQSAYDYYPYPYYPYPYYYDPFMYGYPYYGYPYYGYPYWWWGPPVFVPPSNAPPSHRFDAPQGKQSTPPQTPSAPSKRRFNSQSN